MTGGKVYKPVNKESVVQQVLNKITDAIIMGQFKPGDKLPTEMELIQEFQVSRNSLRSALQTLRSYGILEVRQPEGTFVCKEIKPQVLNPMLFSILIQNNNVAGDIIALREVLDFGISHLIIQNGLSEEDAENLENKYAEFVEVIREENYDIGKVIDYDMAFHSAMAESTHNAMISMLNDFLLNLTVESRRRTVEEIYRQNDREYLVKAHRIHLDALEQKPGSNLSEALSFGYYYWKNSYKL